MPRLLLASRLVVGVGLVLRHELLDELFQSFGRAPLRLKLGEEQMESAPESLALLFVERAGRGGVDDRIQLGDIHFHDLFLCALTQLTDLRSRHFSGGGQIHARTRRELGGGGRHPNLRDWPPDGR